MIFRLNNFNYNLPDLVRRLGYRAVRHTSQGELSCVRPLGGDYPRFHIYLKADEKTVAFNLHLDQKRPSYQGSAAHSGEYEGEIVHGEAERIKEIIFNLN